MRFHGLIVVLAGLFVALGSRSTRAADPPAYVIEPPDILRIDVSGLPKRGQPVRGERLVRPDGTVSLGTHGSVSVSGLTPDQARAAIVKHLAASAKTKDKLEVQVEVSVFNSKNYFVIHPGNGGEQVFRLPIKGNETVVEAVRQVKGMAELAAKKGVWIARPTPSDGAYQILRVDWNGIVRESRTTTNYQVLPSDRVYVGISPPE